MAENLLYLSSDPNDSFMKKASASRYSVSWLDKVPGSDDLSHQGIVIEAFIDNRLKQEVLCSIARCEHWNGPVASALTDGSATEWADRIGLDRVLATLEALTRELGPQYHPCPWIRRKVEAGHLGIRSGRGFYQYSQEEMT